jgi:hypothetical protein
MDVDEAVIVSVAAVTVSDAAVEVEVPKDELPP